MHFLALRKPISRVTAEHGRSFKFDKTASFNKDAETVSFSNIVKTVSFIKTAEAVSFNKTIETVNFNNTVKTVYIAYFLEIAIKERKR